MRKTGVVTGASSGIGKGIALALAKAGYDVVIGHHNDGENALKVAETIQTVHGKRCYIIEGNLEQEHFPEQFARQAIEAYGQIDVLVNNAGVTIFRGTLDNDIPAMNRLFALNFRAPLVLMREVGKHMKECGIAGSIVNIASTRGIRSYPGDSVYGGLKAALIRATQSAALDLAPHNIRVNCIAPGAIQVREEHTEFYQELGKRIPLGRGGQPSDIGAAAVWLVSEQAGYITGTTMQIDGGLILPGMPERVDEKEGMGWGVIRD